MHNSHGLRSIFSVSVVVLAVAFPAADLVGQNRDARPLVISGARLIDGTGRGPRERATVIIEGERITTIVDDDRVQFPPNAQIIDAKGKTLLPGLIDAHVHFREYFGELFLAHGVTTIRDAGNPTAWIVAVKHSQDAGKMRGPRIFAVGNILDAPPPLRPHHTAVDTPEAARSAARDLLANGADGVKVYEKITPELLRPIVEEVHAANKRVIGHITFSAREAALVGIDALEHGSGIALAIARDPALVRRFDDSHTGVFGWRFMDSERAEDVIRLLVERRVAVVPALASWALGSSRRSEFQAEAMRVLADPELAYIPEGGAKNYGAALVPGAPPPARPRGAEETRALAEDYQALADFLRRFSRAGGRIVVGTDGGVLAGLSVHHELQLLVDMGLPPLAAIRAATGDAAELIQAEDVGTIEVGKIADLIIVEGNPLEAIENTKRIGTVIQRGRVVDVHYHRDYRIPVPRP
jgi:imidazolonepropionase-like amidohydrolase